jgi:GT2 family glycosyltransferase
MKRVIASVVAYKNDPVTLSKSMQSFLNSAGDTFLYLIDNSPSDHLRTLITDPRVLYIHIGKNIGFGPGHNVAIRKSIHQAHYHLVLDPDVYFGPEVIPLLYRFMEEEKEIGLVMPKVLYPDGSLQRLCKLLPTPYTLIMRRFLKFLTPLVKRVNRRYELQFADYNKMMDVPFLSGCFMFFRNEALQKVGLFDERFFLYTEDIDLSRRVHQQYRTVYYPHTFIYHFFGKAPYKNIKALIVNIRSAVAYFNKWGWFYDPERKKINRATVAKLTQ